MSGYERLPLADWEVRAVAPGAIASPDGLGREGWTPATAPTTAAAALRAAGAWSLDGPPRRFDAEDWWWRCEVAVAPPAPDEELVLCLDGLATLADVWWNGAHLLSSDDMFVAHEIPLASATGALVVRCRALDADLARKRPRPRWRAPMIENQQLRFARTTLLGRTPGWSPPAAAVGPWREVRIERRRGPRIDEVRLRADLVDGAGVLEVACRARGASTIDLVVTRGSVEHRAALSPSGAGTLTVPGAAPWWPHTHGEPACYHAELEIGGTGGPMRVDLGPVGFRSVALDTGGDDFSLSVNGVRVFCRGACWTPLDPVTLSAPPAALDQAVAQAAAAGMNMLRVGGTMVYESDGFHDACDQRGVLVWQDLMFANMDYPDDDAAFVAAASAEVRQALARLSGRPSLAVVCGGSEVEQQAAMWGAPRERWSPRLFHEILPPIVAEAAPGVPYWPSSAHGGAFPHTADAGTTSYYGVGAYLRPLDDARRAGVRFASECLAFANVPAASGLPGGPGAKVHHPAWKARTPRDLGAGWDFDDVRDHYLAALFGADALALRYADHERYLELGRVVTGEVMAATFAEWRRARSTCRGALVWFLRDLWPGAGWGVVDAAGRPKAAYHALRRALQPVSVAITDEGGNGLAIHVVNERPAPLRAELVLSLFRAGEIAVGGARRAIEVPARGALELPAASLLDHFMDLSFSYRFGPPACDLVVAALEGVASAPAFHLPAGLPRARELDVGLRAEARRDEEGALLTVSTRRFAQSVAIAADGYLAEDDYFHLAPGTSRTVRLAGAGPVRGTVTALNAETAAKIGAAP